MKIQHAALTAFVICFGMAGSAAGQSFLEKQKLLASDGSSGDQFGRSVSVSGNRAIIGSSNSGSAYVFERQTNGMWPEVQKLAASDGAGGDLFGLSVSMSGGRVLVGAFGDDNTNGQDSGAAYVFERQANGAWLEVQKLLASDGSPFDGFGHSVSVSGDRVLFGAYMDDNTNGQDSGAAYVFERQANGAWLEVQQLLASDGAGGDRFGKAVSVSGDHALIGAYLDDDNGTSSGSAYVFERQTNGTWVEAQKLTASDGSALDFFGLSVSVSGDHALIGAYLDDDNGSSSGSAYMFERQTNGTWNQVQKLVADDPGAGDEFGVSVSVSGNRAFIGATGDDNNGADAGSAYVFEQQASGTWNQVQKLLASDHAGFDLFGLSVSVSGDRAVVAANMDDNSNGQDSGSAYVFELETCATDRGFQGPGNIQLSICGDDLTLPGSTATFLVSQALPSSIALLFGSLSNNPTPVGGTLGTLVPVPVLAGFPLFLPTDTAGKATFPVNGGGNSPFTVYLQVLAQNGAVVEFSNAVQLTIGL